MLRIKSAEDFGLGFNCMTRLYMANYEEEILDDMFQVCKEYLKYFSSRTIVCSLRDLVEDYSWPRSNQAMFKIFSWNWGQVLLLLEENID